MSSEEPPSFARSTFVTHSVPDFHPDDSFVVACTVPGQFMHNFRNCLKFHLAEFAAFKYLIERTARRSEPQFLSSVEPTTNQYLNYGDRNVLQGWYPYGERKTRLLDYAEIQGPIGQEKRECPGPIIHCLATKILDAADAIRNGGNPNIRLNIVICGPTSVQQDVLGNLEIPIPSRSEFLPFFWMVEDIRQAIGEGVHSVLITPNMLGAGWVVNPNFTTVDWWQSSRLSVQALRRAACNVAPLIAKSVRTTLIQGIMTSRWSAFSDPNEPRRRLGRELSALREAFQKGSLRFFFEASPATGLNFDSASDNWGTYVEGGRRVSIDQHRRLWERLPQAVNGDQTLFNHDQALAEARSRSGQDGVAGWFDRTLLQNHCKVLAFAQRFDWTYEISAEKKARVLDMNDYQYLPEGMAPGAKGRLTIVSPFRLACHNLADLIVEMNRKILFLEDYGGYRSLFYEAPSVNAYENLDPQLRRLAQSIESHPVDLDQRMSFISSLFYDPTHAELLDDPLSLGDSITNSQDYFIRNVERSDRPFRYLAEILDFPPTAQSADQFDVRFFFWPSCKDAACRDQGVVEALHNLKDAIKREYGES